MTPSPRQSTVVAICFITLVGAVTITALNVYEIDDFLKVWAVLGTLVGVITGAVPSYFFAVSASKAHSQRVEAEEKAQTVLGLADGKLLSEAAEIRPELFGHVKRAEKK